MALMRRIPTVLLLAGGLLASASLQEDVVPGFTPDDAAVVENMKMGEMADMREQAELGKLMAQAEAAKDGADAAQAEDVEEAAAAAAEEEQSEDSEEDGDAEDPPVGYRQHNAETHVAKGSKKHNAETHKPKPLKPTWSPASSHLRSMSELVGKCFDFPISNFNKKNNIVAKYPNDPTHFVDNSEDAIDFKLATLDGDKVALSDLLKEKPVVLLYGMYTCPAFQGYYSSKKTTSHMSKFDEYALVEKYADSVTFVHLYGPEPHPKKPDKNFDTGMIVEFPWSTIRNAKTWIARKSAAEMIQDDLHPAELLLLDNLGGPVMLDHGTEEPPYNPVWCSYGPGARQAFLIGRSGRMYDTQAWFHASTMAGAIEELLLLEAGMVNATDLEDFRQRRSEEHKAVEDDISSVIQEALMVAADGLGEAVGATDEYDRDPRSADAEVSKARVILDEYTSSFVADIYQAKGLEMPEAESKTYSKSKLAPRLEEETTTNAVGSQPSDGAAAMLSAAAPVAGLATAFVVVGAVVRRWRQSQPDSYHAVSGEEADEI